MTIEARTALVTGASLGIGQVIAIRLAEAGIDVAVGFGQERTSAEEQTALIDQLGRRAIEVDADLSDPAQVMSWVDRAEAALGPIDILVKTCVHST